MAELVAQSGKWGSWSHVLKENDVEIAGLRAYKLPDGTIKIYNVLVNPEHRGKGYGVELMAKIVELAKAVGADHLWLFVEKENKVAIHVYKKVGFKVTKHLEDRYEMELPL